MCVCVQIKKSREREREREQREKRERERGPSLRETVPQRWEAHLSHLFPWKAEISFWKKPKTIFFFFCYYFSRVFISRVYNLHNKLHNKIKLIIINVINLIFHVIINCHGLDGKACLQPPQKHLTSFFIFFIFIYLFFFFTLQFWESKNKKKTHTTQYILL